MNFHISLQLGDVMFAYVRIAHSYIMSCVNKIKKVVTLVRFSGDLTLKENT